MSAQNAEIMVSCFLCGADDAKEIFRKSRSGRVVKCRDCGAMYVNPRRSGQVMSAVREGDAPPKVQPDEAKWADANAAIRFALLGRWDLLPEPARLLDVGCWTGFFMRAAKRRGWKPTGIEPVAAAAEWGRENLNLDIRTAIFEDADLPRESFELIAFMHALEHLHDPDAAIRRAHELLKPGGVVAIECPNADSFMARIFGGRWRQFIGDHVSFFTPATIARLLNKNGFSKIRVKSIGRAFPLRLVADRIERHYSRSIGGIVEFAIKCVGASNIGITLNPGDIMFAAAVKR